MGKSIDGQYDDSLFLTVRIYVNEDIWSSLTHRVRTGKDIISSCDILLDMMEKIAKKIHYYEGFMDISQSAYEATLKGEWNECKAKVRIEKGWVENANFNFDINMLEKSIESLYKISCDVEWIAWRYYNTYNEVSKSILESDKEVMKKGVPDCCVQLFKEVKNDLVRRVGLKMLFKLDSELSVIFSPRSGNLTWPIVFQIAETFGSYGADKLQDKLVCDYYKEKLENGLKILMINKIKAHVTFHDNFVFPRHKENKEKLQKFWAQLYKLVESLPDK